MMVIPPRLPRQTIGSTALCYRQLPPEPHLQYPVLTLPGQQDQIEILRGPAVPIVL